MNITSLDAMETIVENNKSLFWNGWNVEERTVNPMAWTKPEAKFIRNTWYSVKTYLLTDSGWDIPTKFVKKNEKR